MLLTRQRVGISFLLVVIAFIMMMVSFLYKEVLILFDAPVAQVIITGERKYISDDDIYNILNDVDNQYLVKSDLQVLRSQLSSLSWVKNVIVRKSWPNKLLLLFEEFEPKMMWNEYYIDVNDTLFFVAESQRIDLSILPIIKSPSIMRDNAILMWHKLLPLLKLPDIALKQLIVNERMNWTLILDNGVKVILGRDSDVIPEKVLLLNQVFPILSKDNQFNYIDLRYPSSLVIGDAVQES